MDDAEKAYVFAAEEPEPKRTMSREVVMVEGISSLVWDGVADGHKIIARGTITLTEGDGL